MLQTTLIGHVKDMDYARRHRILRVFPKRFFSVCDRLGLDLFLFMKTLGVSLPYQTLFGCPIFQNGAHCPHPNLRSDVSDSFTAANLLENVFLMPTGTGISTGT